MNTRILLCLILLTFTFSNIFAQNYRSYDGSGNNLTNQLWGAANQPLQSVTSNGFADGISEPAGANRPNERTISNVIFRQDSILPDVMYLSDYCWVFGQLIDHDVTFVLDGTDEPMAIDVPAGDPWFDPTGSGQVQIRFMRSAPAPGTGDAPDNPRQYLNSITSFIDGSTIYGSDAERARWLRSFRDGKLKTSTGNLLPYNTITGEYPDDIDPDAPHMENPTRITQKLFVAGDARANENPLLLSLHTLFLREHNHQCDIIKQERPNWRDEQIYQEARKRVGAIIQAIVYEEWLPTMGVHLPEYQGYKSDVHPGITNVFSAAAFRMGHTLLNGNIMRLNNNGDPILQGHLSLRDAFFNIRVITDVGGIEPYLKGMGAQTQQSFDARVLDDVRNFLFGPPGAGGLDLAAINIARGRERGLADYNTIRENFGLPRYTSFDEITEVEAVSDTLEALYGDINDIDAWVGMLAEDRMDHALFGELVMAIMKWQFTALRDGDRYYYENDPTLSPALKEEIKNTRLYHILMRNADLSIMQHNVFQSIPHESICDASEPLADVSGQIRREDGAVLGNVDIQLMRDSNILDSVVSAQDGNFKIENLETCQDYVLQPTLAGDTREGVSTFDLVLISKHILNVARLDSPYKIIAADVNNSKTVTTLDLVAIRKVILRVVPEFPAQQVWRFVAADFEFPNPQNPWQTDFPEILDITKLSADATADFIAIKLGDVNYSATIQNAGAPAERSAIPLAVEDHLLKAGEVAMVNATIPREMQYAGMQFSIEIANDKAQIIDITSNNLAAFGPANYSIAREGQTATLSWNNVRESTQRPEFTFYIKATESVRLSEILNLNNSQLHAEVYTEQLSKFSLTLEWRNADYQATSLLTQNYPNPFSDYTTVEFEMPAAGAVVFSVFDISGVLVYQKRTFHESGENKLYLPGIELPASGIYQYKLETPFGNDEKKFIFRK